MKTLTLAVGFAIALVATAGSGIIHGSLTQRWTPASELRDLAGHFEHFPDRVGNWELQSSDTIGAKELALLECAGHVKRTYRNRTNGDTVTLALLLGPAGPMSAHTPDICYSGLDYTDAEKPVTRTIDVGKEHDRFRVLSLQSHALDGGNLRVWYGWTDGGAWTAPESPRFAYVGKPHLFKIQLVSAWPSNAGGAANEPCEDFLRALLPELRQSRFLTRAANNT